MADKISNEIVITSCSNYEVTDTELIIGQNRKRELSISESEFEYDDHTDISKCETSPNKKTPCKDNQSNAICKRISQPSLSDVIQKLTKQIEQIEKKVALSQNFMKNTQVNDEPIYQPPNKIIKYDVEVISAESCNSDENSIGSIKNLNTTKHVNKKIKLDKNIIFQKDIDNSERDCKSLTNEEVEMLLESPYSFDDKIIFDDEDNTHVKIYDGLTNEDSDSVSIPEHTDKLNTPMEHVFNESMLNTNTIVFSSEDHIVSVSNDCSEKIINQNEGIHFSEIEVNHDEVLQTQARGDNVDNSSDTKSINIDGILDLTEWENYEITPYHWKCTSIINEGIKSKSVTFNNQTESSLVELCNSENETISINKLNESDYYEEETVERIIEQTIEDIMVSLDSSNSFRLGIINSSESIRDFKYILEPVDNNCMNSESLTTQEKICFVLPHESKRTGSETNEYNNNIDTSSKSISNTKLIEVRGDNEKIFDYDKTTDQIIGSVNIPDLTDTLNASIKQLFKESILDNMKIDSSEDKSMSQSDDCSEISINKSAELVNVGEVLVSEINDDGVDNCSDPESIVQDDFLDLTYCENDEIMLDHENCTSIINKGINSTMPYINVNSERQTDSGETTHCSGDSKHETDFVPEGKLNDSTKHVDEQEYVCKTQNNQEKNNFEPSNIKDDLFGVHILDVHSKDDSENNSNQRDLLDTNLYAINQTMLENKNSTSKMNPGQKNERNFTNEVFITPVKVSADVSYNGSLPNCCMKVTLSQMIPDQRNKSTLKTLTVEKEEMLTKLLNNEDDELGMVTVCTDKVTTSQTCEDYIYEKNVTDDEVSDYLNSNHLSSNCGMNVTTVDNYDVTISERNSQSSVTGDQFLPNMFYFGSENCRDVSVHTIHTLDGYEMNCSKNTTVSSMDNNDSLVSLNNSIENSTVELCNSENKTLLVMKNKNDDYEEEIVERIIKQIIEDITVSLDSSSTFHHVLKNVCVKDFEKILGSVDESYMNYESLTTQKKVGFGSNYNTNSLIELQRTGSEINEYNNNIDTSSKSISNTKLIEVRGDNEKIFDYDKTTDQIIGSVNIPDLTDTLNASIKQLFKESILDNMKIDSSEDKSMSQSDDCSEISINKSAELVNVGEVLVSEINDDGVDNCSDPESIVQDDFLDLTYCENDEIMLDHENCTSIINKGINSTMPYINVNSERQTDSGETTHCSGDSKHETDFVPEGKLNDSTKHVDEQEYVCKTQNNQEKNNFEPSNIKDDLFGVHILDVHSKDDSENNSNQRDLLDTNLYAINQTMLENKNSTSKMNPGQKNESTLKRLNVGNELGIITDSTDIVTTSQTFEDYIYENVSNKFKNQDDLLEVTLHLSNENASTTSEEKRSDQTDKHNKSFNHENDDTIFINKEINILTERSLSFNSSDARQILESSNNDSEHLDDSLLFKPSDRDLVRYGIECEEYEKSISQSLNNLENNVDNKEVILQYKSPSLKFNDISTSINNLVSSSYAKDYEDNVIDFYDCDLSSIENSDVEDNLLLSFENDSSIDDCIFNDKKDKLKSASNSTTNEQTCNNGLKIQNVGSLSESCNNSTNVVETPVSLIHSPSHDHQNNKIMSTSMSMKQMGMNLDADDKLESANHSEVKITTCNTIPSFNESDNINRIESDELCRDQGELKSISNKDQNLEVSTKNHNQNNENKSFSVYNTHQNIEKSQSPYKDNGSISSKVSSMKYIENKEITKINTVKSTSSDINQSEIEKKKYLDEIIKNEQLFKKFDEKLDVDESIISPYISQSLAKSTNLKSALAKKAAANINIRNMGDRALFTYLTQQTMTLDVLKILHKSLDTCPSSGVLMEDPEGLVVPLMPHQKHAIAWLVWRESQEPRGGILADDMGLGKTLSMISLILKLKEKPQEESIDSKSNNVIIGGTLVVCPASLINQWETEVKTKLKPGLIKVGQYYGINRNFSALELAENDLVITSYHVVMWDHKIRQNSSPLYKIKWYRVILDEGHNIRNHKTQTSVAVCNIKSLNRWAITGTPIHNKEADFFTLLKFVRCKPFDDWPVWKRWVGNNDDAGKHRLSLLVKTLMLRRTKTELTQFTTFNLPMKKIITIEIELSKAERNAYEKLLQFSSNLFATYLYDRAAKEKLFDSSIKVQCKVQYFQEQSQDKDKVFKDHPELLKLFKQFKNIDEIQTYHILVLLLRLRQMCCHPILIKGPITEESIKKEDNIESIPEDDTDEIYNDSCNENKDIDTSPNNIDLSDLMNCLTLEDEPVKIKSVIDKNIFQKTYVSSKIKKICDLVNQKILINGGNDKAIIVSQWPSFLYLIKKNLAHYNAKIEMFSGAIPIPKRNKIIRDFNNPDEGPQILLLSLKAGGVGLNLMAANHMFLIDVHWNPQLEAQACDRVYRVGQIKPVYIYKFISNNTIETRILNIQALKLQIAENLFKGTSVASSKITIDDLKQIFQFH